MSVLSSSRAAAAATAAATASASIMCFYLWDTWSCLAGNPQSWTLNTVSLYYVWVCVWFMSLSVNVNSVKLSWLSCSLFLCISQVWRFGSTFSLSHCYNCFLSWQFSLLLFCSVPEVWFGSKRVQPFLLSVPFIESPIIAAKHYNSLIKPYYKNQRMQFIA